MEKSRLFTYSWHIDEDEEDITCLRIYGVDEKEQNVCLRVDDFTPYIYLELPDRIKWTAGAAQKLGNKIDELMGKQRPLQKKLMWKHKLYGAHLEDDMKTRKLYPYMFCKFSTQNDIKSLGFRLRKMLHIAGLGAVKLKIHEAKADPVLQLTCCRNIPTAGWVEFHGKQVDDDDHKVTLCDQEWKVKWKHLFPFESDKIARPKILSFDIEVNSSNPATMPKAERPGDKVFQISCVLGRYGDKKEDYEKYLLTLGQPDPDIVGDDVLVYMYETESSLLEGFTEFIREENPNLIAGYNILGFDIDYMLQRAKWNMCVSKFDKMGFHKFAHAKEKTIKWSSSAYKNQEFQYLDAEGRVFIDLLPLVRRDFKFSNYKLKTISTYFLGCLDPNTPILLWNGETRLAKDIKIGDELIGDDGTKRTVQDLCSGEDDMYRIKQHKSDNYIVNSQHILTFKISGHGQIYWEKSKEAWSMAWYDRKEKKIRIKCKCTKRSKKTIEELYGEMVEFRKTIDTNDILEIKVIDYLGLSNSTKARLKGYKCNGVNWDTQEVPIDPYIFGMWLGDGDSDGRGFTSQDEELIKIWEEWCVTIQARVEHVKRYNYRIKNTTGARETPPFKKILSKHGLVNNKSIPSVYMQNDRKTRLKLLAGVIDTDGHVANGTEIIITQVRKKLSDQLLYLARSLGFSCIQKERKTKWEWNGVVKYGKAYAFSIVGDGLEEIPTVLKHKRCCERKQKKNALVTGVQIEYIGKGPFVGWQIDGNKRFLLGDFTVTHNSTKDPLSVKGIFKCYRIGIKKNENGEYSNRAQKAMAVVGKYCVQDSALVLRLMDVLQTWIGLTEMAKTCGVSIFTLYTQGQQIKVYSQIYKYCMNNNIVVEQDAYNVGENERYVGAYVVTPVPGRYQRVVPFDFASLYPTTIIAYNIDYHTWVPDDSDIPDEMCHVLEWDDHQSCEHDPKMIRVAELNEYIIKEEEKIKRVREKRNALRVSGVMAKYKCDRNTASKKLKKENERLTKLQNGNQMLKEEVTEENIAEVVSKWTGIPVSRLMQGEIEKLLSMEKILKMRVIGQDEAVELLSNTIRRSRSGLQDPNRPIGSFIFIGPTGVGKTYLAKNLAAFLFDDEKELPQQMQDWQVQYHRYLLRPDELLFQHS